MFKATIADVAVFRDSIIAIAELIDEGIFKITKNGMSLLAADRAMVSVVDFKLPATVFEEYKVEKDQTLGVNISNFVSVIKRAKPEDKLTFELKGNTLEVRMLNGGARKFVVPLLDIKGEEIPPIDQLAFKAKVKVKVDVLKSGVEDANVVADTIVFHANDGTFRMNAAGDISSTELVLEKGNDSLISLEVDGDVKARYPLDYLRKMIKASKLSDEATISWAKDYPLKLGFKDVDKVEMNFILAPRVQDD
ncbi:proliferating cell nuclear antigen (pcna) [Candidatus Micrarchaeota archaeon RBG_16_49_10]|nr:MAG: proliferating cell nuclear antigen (pcna) [Candidatus Micrarchaeota archaeon RBG_16_49_10]